MYLHILPSWLHSSCISYLFAVSKDFKQLDSLGAKYDSAFCFQICPVGIFDYSHSLVGKNVLKLQIDNLTYLDKQLNDILYSNL